MVDCAKAASQSCKGFLLSNENWKVSVIGRRIFRTIRKSRAARFPAILAFGKMHKKWLNPIYEKGVTASNNLEAREMPVDEVGEDIPTLFIVRGLPGAGKTAMAKAIADESYENDQYMTVTATEI